MKLHHRRRNGYSSLGPIFFEAMRKRIKARKKSPWGLNEEAFSGRINVRVFSAKP